VKEAMGVKLVKKRTMNFMLPEIDLNPKVLAKVMETKK
jgi:hypothetical protein